MKKFAAFIVLFFCVATGFAQYNDSTFHRINVTSTGSINKTNDGRSYLLNNGVNFGIKKKDVVLSSTNTFVYGNQNNTLTNRDFSSSLFFNLYKTLPRFYYWGLLNYNTSYSLKINNQILGGVGVAYSIIDNKDAYINFSDGVLYDKSSLLGGSLDYSTYRNSFRINYHFAITQIITLDGSNFLQSSFNNGNDYIIKSTNTISFKLNKWINLTSSLNYNRMNITSRENLLFTYGLSFDKYF